MVKKSWQIDITRPSLKIHIHKAPPFPKSSFNGGNMFDDIICWFAGHIPSDNFLDLGFEDVDNFEVRVHVCQRCNALIVFDNNYGWIKWD